MVGTPGKETATLTDSDLQAWNVRIIRAGYTPPPTYTPPPPPYTPPTLTPSPPADIRSKGQRIYDFALRSEGTPMSKFSEIIDYDWTGKVEYFKSMGAQFTKDCGGGTCKYRGELWSPNRLGPLLRRERRWRALVLREELPHRPGRLRQSGYRRGDLSAQGRRERSLAQGVTPPPAFHDIAIQISWVVTGRYCHAYADFRNSYPSRHSFPGVSQVSGQRLSVLKVTALHTFRNTVPRGGVYGQK